MNSTLHELITRQIKNELDSFYLYLQIATWFDENKLPGFARLLRLQAQEEAAHAKTIFNYLRVRGMDMALHQIAATEFQCSTVREVVAHALARAKFIALEIKGILDMAESVGDSGTAKLLAWLASVQLHEEAVILDLVERVNNLANGGGDNLLDLDKELAALQHDYPEPFRLPPAARNGMARKWQSVRHSVS